MINDLSKIYSRNPLFKEIAISKSLSELRSIMLSDKNLEISKNATNCVFGEGSEKSKLMLLGEAPGKDEDRTGVPFCGRSGKFLDKLLLGSGFSRKDDIYITNTVNWRPDNNRVPTEEEIFYCLPYLEKHIELQNPKLIATLGATATFALLNKSSKPDNITMKNMIGNIFK